jgi:hypothetical protein
MTLFEVLLKVSIDAILLENPAMLSSYPASLPMINENTADLTLIRPLA